jgi:hypothetical protein
MKIQNNYTFSNNRQIWRIIPGGKNKLVIEERDPSTKEVFFSCIDMLTGKLIIDSLQFDEKFWIGIEDVYKDVIFFHKYNKPDMPGHSDIIAYDINESRELWNTERYLFSLVFEDNLYCFRNEFEGRKYYKLNYRTGEMIEEFGDSLPNISELKEFRNIEIYEGYKFPEVLSKSNEDISDVFNYLNSNDIISGKVDYTFNKDLFLTSYHKVLDNGKLQNHFIALEILSKKIIFKLVLNEETTNYIPDSFFLINDLIFLLKEKEQLIVLIIKE